MSNKELIKKEIDELPEILLSDVQAYIQKIKQSTILKAHKTSPNELQDLILNAPTWSDSDFKAYTQARNQFNTSRLS